MRRLWQQMQLGEMHLKLKDKAAMRIKNVLLLREVWKFRGHLVRKQNIFAI